MKNNIKLIIGIVIGILLSGITVYAATYISKDITFSPSDENWNVNNVEDALNELYQNNGLKSVPIQVGTGALNFSSGSTGIVVPATYSNEEYLSLSNNVFTVKKPGYYVFAITVGSSQSNTSAAGGYNGYIEIRINGEKKVSQTQSWSICENNFYSQYLNEGDTIYAYSLGNGGSAPKRSIYRIIYAG